MEERVVINCPHCWKPYSVRKSVLGQSARCPECREIFTLQVDRPHSEDEITNWLHESAGGPAPNATQAGLRVVDEPEDTGSPVEPAAAFSERPESAQKPGQKLLLHTVDQSGAHFQFDAALLRDLEFRASFPRLCAQCLADHGLTIHLVQWPDKLPPHEVVGGRSLRTPAVVKVEELPTLDPVKALEYLARQDYLPEPFDLPFPYYVCEDCSPTGLVYTNISVSDEGEQYWLSVLNLHIACLFFANNCGTNNDTYRKLRSHSELRQESRWDALPLVIRDRMSRWFKLKSGEHFVEYVPDNEFSKMEAGLGGVVITDQRLVYQKREVTREYPLKDPLTVTKKKVHRALEIEISSLACGTVTLQVDNKSWDSMKNHLDSVGARVRIVVR